jgi:hypothetical protein
MWAIMATAFDNEKSLTPEEIMIRFKKIMGTDVTPEERHSCFLPEPCEVVAKRIKVRAKIGL